MSDRGGIPEFGVRATVFMDRETHGPTMIGTDIGLQSAEEYFDYGDSLPTQLLANVSVVSTYAMHVALYALQNPTPENIRRALYSIGTSGDCEEHIDPETLMPLPVPAPPGWSDWTPEG